MVNGYNLEMNLYNGKKALSMKSKITLFRILMVLGLISLVSGTCIATSSVNNVFIGIFFILVAALLELTAVVFIIQANTIKEKQKEDRLKKLEDELAELKGKLNHTK